MASEISSDTGGGPEFAHDITEVVAVFSDDAMLEDAVNRLTLAGFDRAELSLPVANPTAEENTPETGATPLNTGTDRQQARILGTSVAASAVAMAAVGITIATGGAAIAGLAAAAIAGGATAVVTNAIGQGMEGITQADREMAGQAGDLSLSVRVTSPARTVAAEAALYAAGGQQIIVRSH
jgi:hypothetical protein